MVKSKPNNCQKFYWLLWKNVIVQWHYKIDILFQLLLPILLCAVLTYLGVLPEKPKIEEFITHFPGLNISTLDMFK